jgi:hypothetical protein
MKRRGEMRREMKTDKRKKLRCREKQTNGKDGEGRMAIEEDQNGVFWS